MPSFFCNMEKANRSALAYGVLTDENDGDQRESQDRGETVFEVRSHGLREDQDGEEGVWGVSDAVLRRLISPFYSKCKPPVVGVEREGEKRKRAKELRPTGSVKDTIHGRDGQSSLFGIPIIDLVGPGPHDGSDVSSRDEEESDDFGDISGGPGGQEGRADDGCAGLL